MWKCCTSIWSVCFMVLTVLYGEVVVVDSQFECYEDIAQLSCPTSDEYTYIAESLYTYFHNHNEITFPVCTSSGTPWDSQNSCTSIGAQQFVEESCSGSKSCDTYVNYNDPNDASSVLGVYRINYFCCEPVNDKIRTSPACDWLDSRTTPASFNYQFFPTEIDMTEIHFRVKASSNAYIGLSTTSSEQPVMYELVFGGLNNKYSFIRRCPATNCPNALEKVYTDNILSTTEYRGFWITYDYPTGRLVVGRDGQGSFMSWSDPSPLDVRYMGYSTGSAGTGEFQFCNYTNDCSPDPCLNGASCVDGVNSFTCTCIAGYMGTNCETDIDDCSPDPCLNGAPCVDGVNSFTCTCVAGYMGTNCETDLVDCYSAPCLCDPVCIHEAIELFAKLHQLLLIRSQNVH